ncbi:Protein-S-isoprenylcysteine O-methyltransferase [Bagarius yarrelli]|uniref:Protein-S-isoprenylcysteine O-methyltransferase n=1 Tax=Bagarius yarrelli TaxID=175774 RepID=A0A556U2A5_BAGYA|nr:Protein-S-isoprenylcysteine O-methyltransferase [Bagarius yarrelli]
MAGSKLVLEGRISVISFLFGLGVIIIPLFVKFGSHVDWIFDYLTDVNGKIAIALYITVLNGFLLIIYKGPLYKVRVGHKQAILLFNTRYLCSLAFFHYSEYLVTAIINPRSLSLDSFLLNHSVEYTVAAISSWMEFILEKLLVPELKQLNWLSFVGLIMVLCGEGLRKSAMLTAGSNFNHIVQNEKAQSHVLVTSGVYSFFRHPSYVGWFYWSIGTQIMLCNPLCLLAYTLASWRFFKERVEEEEIFLIHFFGEDYIEYKDRVPSGLPFISGIRENEGTRCRKTGQFNWSETQRLTLSRVEPLPRRPDPCLQSQHSPAFSPFTLSFLSYIV